MRGPDEDVVVREQPAHPHRPAIGITPCETIADYVSSIEAAGGEARVLDGVSPDLRGLGGLLLTGGGDIDPIRYGQCRNVTDYEIQPERDEFELAVTILAIERDLPLLGICRGLQVLNVALAGDLVQDIPTQVVDPVPHRLRTRRDAYAHEVRVRDGRRTAELLRRELGQGTTCLVNSRHHQSPGRLGRDLVVGATAPDGVVEAVERPAARFCVAVQWHPENFWRTGRFLGLFRGLVDAARTT